MSFHQSPRTHRICFTNAHTVAERKFELCCLLAELSKEVDLIRKVAETIRAIWQTSETASQKYERKSQEETQLACPEHHEHV
jgi:predicted transcriptional regulator